MGLLHIIKSQQFGREDLDELFQNTDKLRGNTHMGTVGDLVRGKIMASLFYEESTRTRFSFESAMIRIGGSVLSTENAKQFSSAAKGERLDNTIRVVSSYVDVIVLRHFLAGATEEAARVSKVPVINAGDGPGQHPTQALLDIYTIRRELGDIDGIRIALVGDLANGRAARSLAYLLAKYRIEKIFFVSPPLLRMNNDIKEYLGRHNIAYTEEDDLNTVARQVDVLYQTRIQKERFGDRIGAYIECCGQYIVSAKTLSYMQNRAIVMHPLPINQDGAHGEPPEITEDITAHIEKYPRVAYIRQAENGLYVRMALLKQVLTATQF